MLKLFNTLSQKKEEFRPADPNRVTIYNCGPTVYNFNHIGNFRSYVAVDQLRRYLKFRGYTVDHTSNITDIDDKIIDNALAKGQTIEQFVGPYIEAFLEDLKTLSIEPVEHRPRATRYIDSMLQMMKDLETNGHTYVLDGSVYYRISSFRDYGRLSKIEAENLVSAAGGRFDADEYTKEDVRDFALWKKPTRANEPAWESPYGQGRPGWHLECSAMIHSIYGHDGIDIHAGGIDLVFPHHENEIAQSCGAHPGENFVRTWFHNEHLLVEGKKMSKSLGNFYTLRDLTTEDGANQLIQEGRAPEWLIELVKSGEIARCIRYVLLATNYRMKLNFTFAQIQSARSSIERMQKAVDRLIQATGLSEQEIKTLYNERRGDRPGHGGAKLAPHSKEAAQSIHEFIEAMDDDLNISKALAAAFEMLPRANTALDREAAKEELTDFLIVLYGMDSVFGLLRFHEEAKSASLSADEIEGWIEKRNDARKRKDFAEADRIRDELLAKGIVIKDTPKGTTWEPA
ncbi:cysteine--tRNA ligase [Leptonema illini]|uniref:Cysteine--tRNA ligase n=1 Tax=Leptonema illini DSM 21528 TaxID=929563 RepID=H2CGV2_9LEPT|nr:cysteine--tRNA ligase [Leptonema illini]EHQ05794.1 cysteinyl-tRNA synthetase [Leptonema illini DSM 21528]